MGELVFALIVAHHFGDYVFQNDFLATWKGKSDYILFVHVLIWTGCICGVLGFFGVFAWWKVLFLFVGHFLVDRWKARKNDKSKAMTHDLWKDQFVHIIQILVVAI